MAKRLGFNTDGTGRLSKKAKALQQQRAAAARRAIHNNKRKRVSLASL